MAIVFHCNTGASERAFCAKIQYTQYGPNMAAIMADRTPLKAHAHAAERVPREDFSKSRDLKHDSAEHMK